MIQLAKCSDIPSPVVVEGFVSDAVLSNTIEKPIVSISIKGNAIIGNTALNSPGKHDKGHYDGVITGLAGDSVKVSAYDQDNPSCKGEVSKLLTGDGKLILDVPLCCYPTSASNLKPDKPLHLTSPTETTFSWTKGTKENPSYPDFWENFKGPQSILNPANPLKLTLDKLDGWSIQTCNGIQNTNKFCCSEKSVGIGYQNNPCNSPTNLKGEFKAGFIVTTWDSEPKDSDGDDCHDEWKASSLKEGDALSKPSWTNLVNNANKQGELATAYLVTFWQVRSCDNQERQDSCSPWVDAITASCNKISDECPNIKEVSEYLGGYGTKLSTEMYCNGIKINDSSLIKKIDLIITSNKKEINILSLKNNKYNLDHCPWCYDGIKDYDEDEIDCGGSCQSCSLESAILKDSCNYYMAVFLILILLIITLLSWIEKQKIYIKPSKEIFSDNLGFFKKIILYLKKHKMEIYKSALTLLIILAAIFLIALFLENCIVFSCDYYPNILVIITSIMIPFIIILSEESEKIRPNFIDKNETGIIPISKTILIILIILDILAFISIFSDTCISSSCMKYSILLVIITSILITFAILSIKKYKEIKDSVIKISDIIKDIIKKFIEDKKFRIYVIILVFSLIFFIYFSVLLFINDCLNIVFILYTILIIAIIFLIVYISLKILQKKSNSISAIKELKNERKNNYEPNKINLG